MIALALLFGGAIFVGLYVWAGSSALVAFALTLLAVVVGRELVGIAQLVHDRRVAYRRWRSWRG